MVTLERVRDQQVAIGKKDYENSLVSPQKRTLLDIQLTWEKILSKTEFFLKSAEQPTKYYLRPLHSGRVI